MIRLVFVLLVCVTFGMATWATEKKTRAQQALERSTPTYSHVGLMGAYGDVMNLCRWSWKMPVDECEPIAWAADAAYRRVMNNIRHNNQKRLDRWQSEQPTPKQPKPGGSNPRN